jgi:hypothetical protein
MLLVRKNLPHWHLLPPPHSKHLLPHWRQRSRKNWLLSYHGPRQMNKSPPHLQHHVQHL